MVAKGLLIYAIKNASFFLELKVALLDVNDSHINDFVGRENYTVSF